MWTFANLWINILPFEYRLPTAHTRHQTWAKVSISQDNPSKQHHPQSRVCLLFRIVIKWGIHIRQGRKEEYVLCNLILMDVGNAVDTIDTDRPEHAVDNNDNTYLHIIKWLIAITDREKSASVWRASSSDWGLMLDQSIQ